MPYDHKAEKSSRYAAGTIATTKGMLVKNIAKNNVITTLRLCFIMVISVDQSKRGIFKFTQIPKNPENTHAIIGMKKMKSTSATVKSKVTALAITVKITPGSDTIGAIKAFAKKIFMGSIGVDFKSHKVLPSKEIVGAVTSFIVQHNASDEPIIKATRFPEASGNNCGREFTIKSPLSNIPTPKIPR